jgi:hypothetical protein
VPICDWMIQIELNFNYWILIYIANDLPSFVSLGPPDQVLCCTLITVCFTWFYMTWCDNVVWCDIEWGNKTWHKHFELTSTHPLNSLSPLQCIRRRWLKQRRTKDGANAVGMVMDFKTWRRVTRTLFK